MGNISISTLKCRPGARCAVCDGPVEIAGRGASTYLIPLHHGHSCSLCLCGPTLKTYVDNPETDGTDFASMAWWRGNDQGADGTARALKRVAEEGYEGHFGGDTVHAAAEAIDSLRCRISYLESELKFIRKGSQ